MKKVILVIVSILIILLIIGGGSLLVFNYLKSRNEEPSDSNNPNNGDESVHVHSYEAYWSMDEFEHWHRASCGHGDKDRATHTFDENDICVMCDYDATCGFEYEKIQYADGEAWAVARVKSGNTAEYLDIPSSFRGLPVKKIGSSVLSGSAAKKIMIMINGSIAEIASDAFANNEVLEELSFDYDSRITRIEDRLFLGCSNLKSVYLHHGITSIGNSAFEGCTILSNLYLNSNEGVLESIGEYAFKDCRGLTRIELPKSLKSIGSYAFNGCSRLVSISIPSRTINMGYGVFADCSNLKICCERESRPSEWDIDWNVDDLPVIWDCRDYGVKNGFNWVLFNSSGSVKITAYSGTSMNIKDIEIPATINGVKVASIESHAFDGCRITSVTFEENCQITSIGDYAFRACVFLTDIELPASLTHIGEYAFHSCQEMTSINIPDKVSSIGSHAFYRCNNLASIKMPKSLTNISDHMFCACYNLTSIVIPKTVISIDEYVFESCNNLQSVTFETDSQLTSIGENAFKDCSKLTSFVIPQTVTSVGDYAFRDCSNMSSIEISKGILNMGNSVFRGCSSLTIYCEEESLPSGWNTNWRNVHPMQFVPVAWDYKKHGTTDDGINWVLKNSQIMAIVSYSGSPTEIVVPATINGHAVTYIGAYSFHNRSSLISVVIPIGVTTIERYAFMGCNNLTIYCEADSQPSGWDVAWNYGYQPVEWGYVRGE